MTPRAVCDRRRIGRVDARRGYALVLVVALSAVFVIMVSLMLDRDGVSVRASRRMAETYAEHHLSKGMQEGISAWMRSNAGLPIGAALDESGRAFTLRVDGGQEVDVYLRPAQGTLLAELSGMTGISLEVGLRALKNLVDETQGDREQIGRLTRTQGPMQVSVRDAAPEVLQAIAGAVLDDSDAAEFLDKLAIAIAEGEGWEPVPIAQVYSQAGVTETERAMLQMLLVGETSLWEVVLEARPRVRRPGVEPVRYGGLLYATSSPMRMSASESVTQRNTGFLTWERLENR